MAGRRIAWIDRSVWPYGKSLIRPESGDSLLLERSLFVATRNKAERFWAIELALRSPAVALTVADATELDRVSMRRLQLAAEIGGGLALLARPPVNEPLVPGSASRWLVRHLASADGIQRWTVELLRCKGLRPGVDIPRTWILERDCATSALRLLPDLRHRLGDAPSAGQRNVG